MHVLNWTPKRPGLPMTLCLMAAGLAIAIGATTALMSDDSRAAAKPQQTAGLAVTTTEVATTKLPLRIPASGTIEAFDEIIVGSDRDRLDLLLRPDDVFKRGTKLVREPAMRNDDDADHVIPCFRSARPKAAIFVRSDVMRKCERCLIWGYRSSRGRARS